MINNTEYENNYIIINQLPINVRKILVIVNYKDTKTIIQALNNLDEVENTKSRIGNLETQSGNYREIRQLNVYRKNSNDRKYNNFQRNMDRPNKYYYRYNEENRDTRRDNEHFSYTTESNRNHVRYNEGFTILNLRTLPPGYSVGLETNDNNNYRINGRQIGINGNNQQVQQENRDNLN